MFHFQTVFSPIQGLDQDLNNFIDLFVKLGSLRFVDFSRLWREQKFLHLIHGWQNQHGLYDILGCIFHRLIGNFLPDNPESSLSRRICSLYLLYAFFGKQPMQNHIHIRVCPRSWSGLANFAQELRDAQLFDAYYIFRQLCATNAFHFCANRQVLYPGVPLFNSPSSSARSDETENPVRTSRQDAFFKHIASNITSRSSLSSELKLKLDCLDTVIRRYAQAKAELDNVQGSTSKSDPRQNESSSDCVKMEDDYVRTIGEETVTVDDENHRLDDTFLPGLNFVNYPTSLDRLKELFSQLEQPLADHAVAVQPIQLSPDDNSDASVDDDDDCEQEEEEEPTSSLISSPPPQDTIGLRRKLLRDPANWSSELQAQADRIRQHGPHLDRRRPEQAKLDSLPSTSPSFKVSPGKPSTSSRRRSQRTKK